jgi:hypothetical protein
MGLFCAEPHEISLLSVLWYIHSGGGISRLSETSNGAQVRVMSLGVFRAFNSFQVCQYFTIYRL